MSKILDVCLALTDHFPERKIPAVPPVIPRDIFFYRRLSEIYRSYGRSYCHGNYILCYVISGERIVKIDETLFQLKSGEIIIIPPYHQHSFFKTEHFIAMMASFSLDNTEKRLMPITGKVIKINKSQENILAKSADGFLKRLEGNILAGEEGACLLGYFLQILQGKSGTIGELKIATDHEYTLLSRIMEYILTHMDHRVTLKELERALHVSGSTIRQKFRKTMNRSIGRYQLQRRLMIASQLLTNSELSVEEIASRVGFVTAEGMRRAFKRESGESPMQLRKNARKHYEESVK